MAQPQGTGLCQTGRLQTHSPGPDGHEAAHGPLTKHITEVLTRHGVVSDWQQGALPG